MNQAQRTFCTLTAALAFGVPSARVWSAQRDGGDDRKPSLALKATPPVGFSPLRVRVVVDARGGANDYADFYCPAIEWDWGDGTVSENSSDCDPYEAGSSTIQRRWSAEHVYRRSSSYKVIFRLKQRNREVAVGATTVQVRAGARDDFGG